MGIRQLFTSSLDDPSIARVVVQLADFVATWRREIPAQGAESFSLWGPNPQTSLLKFVSGDSDEREKFGVSYHRIFKRGSQTDGNWGIYIPGNKLQLEY